MEYRKVYNYILGLYLGDGCISGTKDTKKFRIFLDDKYPYIIEKAKNNLDLLFPYNTPNTKHSSEHCIEVYLFNTHLVELFPQHGLGKKHDRDVSLVPWQKQNIEYDQLALGLFHSDGCYYESLIKNKKDIGKDYVYKNYGFKNCSLDIIEIYKECLDNLEIEYRVVTCSKSKTSNKINGRFIINKTQAYDVVVTKKKEVEKLISILGKKY